MKKSESLKKCLKSLTKKKGENKMKKSLAIIIILLTISCFSIITCAVVSANTKNEYPLTTVVYDVSKATDTVTVIDYNGNLWQFKGVEDWTVDDVCSCIMNSKGTALIKDDEIVKVQYSGWLEGWK